MALILILACAAIAVLEIYLARGARELERRVADQDRRITEQDQRLGRLSVVDTDLQRLVARGSEQEHSVRAQDGRLEGLTRDLEGHLAELRTEVTDIHTEVQRLDDRTGRTEQALTETRTDLGRLARELDDRDLPGLSAELTRLARNDADLHARLHAVEQRATALEDREATLLRALEAQEAEAAGVRRRLVRALDQQADVALGGTDGPVIVRGAVYGDAGGVERLADSLVRRYELCAEEYGLTTELRTPALGSGTYYLSCADPRLVEAAFLEQMRRLRGHEQPEDSLYALLTGLRIMHFGLAQLGAFVAARTPDDFRCAVLTPQEIRRFRAEVGPEGPHAALEVLLTATEQRSCDLLATWPELSSDSPSAQRDQ